MRTLKWTALVLASGMLFQLSGCASIVADILLNAVISGAASSILGGTTTTT